MLPIPEILLDTQCRFWEKVDHKSDSECWNWVGSASDGYGNIRINNEIYQAHRISYYIHYKDPGELLVCHECNNTFCVNPQHLFLGTVSNNMQHAFDTGNKSNKGSLNSQTRLLESHILEIRKLHGTMTQKEIGEIYCVSESTINEIINRKRWRHVA